jgi:hypothetical protein
MSPAASPDPRSLAVRTFGMPCYPLGRLARDVRGLPLIVIALSAVLPLA